MSARRRVAACIAAMLLCASCASGGDSARDAGNDESPLFTSTSGPSPSSLSSSSTNASSTSTVASFDDVELASVDDVLPHPEHSPANAYEDVPVDQKGTIRIPAIGLTHPVYEGVWLTIIDKGPGHWPGSAWPGSRGNAVFPGHRVTHSHPFIDLDKLRPGDDIFFDMPEGTFTYRVRETMIVKPSDIWVVDQHENAEVTLIACHPKHSAQQRIVVKGDLVNSQLTPAAATAAADLADALASAAS